MRAIRNATGVSLTDVLASPQSLSFLGQLCASEPDMLQDPSLKGKGILSLSPINFRRLWKNKWQAMLNIHLFLKLQTNHGARSESFLDFILVLGWVLGWVLVVVLGLGSGLVSGLGLGLGLGRVLGRALGWVFYGITAGSKALPRTIIWLAAGIAAGMTRKRMVEIVGEDTAAEIGERLHSFLDEKTMQQAGFERPRNPGRGQRKTGDYPRTE